ncbi:MAG TPA: type II toxin-antitoxin system VapC family toxin [Acidobacteriota bacterium]
MVVDTSIVLAVFFNEKHGRWAAEMLTKHSRELRMSTVNLAEALIRVRDRQPRLYRDLENKLVESGIRFIAPTVVHARLAAEARLKYPLNLGDCFAYALAAAENCPILTTDSDFKKVDVAVLLPS